MDVYSIALKADTRDIDRGKERLRDLGNESERTDRKVSASARRMASESRQLAAALRTVAGLFASIQAARAVREITRISDEYANVRSRLKLVTESTEELNKVQEALFKVAQETSSEFSGVAELYSRTGRALKDLNLTTEQAVDFNRLVAQSFAISGASTAEAAGAIRQLSQALQSGVLRGDEFNSINEQGGRLMQALADGMRVSRGALRGLAEQGKLTSDVVLPALMSQVSVLGREFSSLDDTVGRAAQRLRNDFQRSIAQADMSELIAAMEELRAVLTDPEVQQGLLAIATGLVKIASAATEATAKFGILASEIAKTTRETLDGGDALDAYMVAISPFRKLKIVGQSVLSLMADEIEEVGTASATYKGPVSEFFKSIEDMTGRGGEFSLLVNQTADGFFNWGRGAAAAAEGTKQFSESVAEQIAEMQAVLDLTRQGIALAEAETRARLAAAGASAEQIEEYIKAQRALAGVADAEDKAAEARRASEQASEDAAKALSEYAGGLIDLRAQLISLSRTDAESAFDTLLERLRQIDLLLANDLLNPETAADLASRFMDQYQESFASGLDSLAETTEKQLESLKDLLSFDIGLTLADSFNESTRAAFELLNASEAINQAQIRYQAVMDDADATAEDRAAAEMRWRDQQLKGTAAVLGAIQGATKKGGDGYKALGVIIQALNTVTGIQAILAQAAAGDPFTAFARAAAMAGLVASLGVTIAGAFGGGGGGGSDPLSGTVLGDDKSRSESIERALEITAESTEAIVGINTSMLRSLQTLTASINNLGGLLARQDLGSISIPQPNASAQAASGGAALGVAAFGGFIDIGVLALGANKVIKELGRALDKIGLDFVGSVLGGVGDLVIGGLEKIGEAIFGGERRATQQGVEILAGTVSELIDGTLIQGYARIRKSRGLRGPKYYDQILDLPGEVESQFQLVFSNIVDTVIESATALGIDQTQIDRALQSVEIEAVRFNFLNKTGEEIAEELNAGFSNIFDKLAMQVVPFIDSLAQIGEGAGETLVRVASSIAVANAGLERVGQSIAANPLEEVQRQYADLIRNIPGLAEAAAEIDEMIATRIARISTALIDAAGGFSEFAELTGNFVKQFRSEQEQFDIATREATSAMEDLGFGLPATREAFVALLDGFQITDEASAQLYVSLLQLAPALDAVYDTAERISRDAFQFGTAFGLNDGLDPLRKALLDVGLSLSEVQQAANGGNDALRDLFVGLTEAERAALEPFTRDILALVPPMEDVVDVIEDTAEAAIRLAESIAELGLALRRQLVEIAGGSVAAFDIQQVLAGIGAATTPEEVVGLLPALQAALTDSFNEQLDVINATRDAQIDAAREASDAAIDGIRSFYDAERQAAQAASAAEVEATLALIDVRQRAAERQLENEQRLAQRAFNEAQEAEQAAFEAGRQALVSAEEALLDQRLANIDAAQQAAVDAFEAQRVAARSASDDALSAVLAVIDAQQFAAERQLANEQRLERRAFDRQQELERLAFENGRQSLVDAVNEQMEADLAAIDAQIEAARELGQTVERLRDTAAGLREFVEDFARTDAAAQPFEEALRQFQALASAARGGDVDAAGRLQGVASDILSRAEQNASTEQELRRIQSQVLRETLAVADALDVASMDEQTLEALEAQQEAIRQAAQAQIDALNAQTEELSLAFRYAQEDAAYFFGLGLQDVTSALRDSFQQQIQQERESAAAALQADLDAIAEAQEASAAQFDAQREADRANTQSQIDAINEQTAVLERALEYAQEDAAYFFGLAQRDASDLLRQTFTDEANAARDQAAALLDAQLAALDAMQQSAIAAEEAALRAAVDGINASAEASIQSLKDALTAQLTGLLNVLPALAEAQALDGMAQAQALEDAKQAIVAAVNASGDLVYSGFEGLGLALQQAKLEVEVVADFLANTEFLPDDLRVLAGNAYVEVQRLVSFIANADQLPTDLRILASETATTLVRGIQFIVEQDVPPDVKELALKINDTLTRDVRAVLASDLDIEAKTLALQRAAEYTTTVNAVLASGIDNDAKRLALDALAIGTGTVSVDADVSLNPSGRLDQAFTDLVGNTSDTVDALDSGLYWWNSKNLVTESLFRIAASNGAMASGLSNIQTLADRSNKLLSYIALLNQQARNNITSDELQRLNDLRNNSGQFISTPFQSSGPGAFGSYQTALFAAQLQPEIGFNGFADQFRNLQATPSALGNAFVNGQVQAFADGGMFTNSVVSDPTIAPMALFGEAGPEAILPLTRLADGSLGVRAMSWASGGGDATAAEVRALRAELADLKRSNREGQMAIAKYTMETSKQLRRWDDGDRLLVRVEQDEGDTLAVEVTP
jgi:tape measure domain-containing protein